MSEYSLVINGDTVTGAASYDVINPATEEVLAQAPNASVEQLNEAVQAAKDAFPAWSKTEWAERQAILNKLAGIVNANIQELAQILTKEQGKPLEVAMGEVGGAGVWLSTIASFSFPEESVKSMIGNTAVIERRPLGVVGAILPWNFPVLLVVMKIAPALLTGNTIVIKPAPTTPLATLKLIALFQEVLPAGVLNVISGLEHIGPAMTSHPDIDKISFTGSSPTGKSIMASSAETLKRVTLELGGNDAAIVLPDADVDKIAEGIFQTVFGNSGQVCIAIKRLYVHESLADALTEKLVALAKASTVGNGLEKGVQFGPVQNKMQFEKLSALLDGIRNSSAKVHCGGEVSDEKGYFIPLTIVSGATEDSDIVSKEQFGPILPILTYTDVDDAVSRANALDMGLGGSVWGADVQKAAEIARQLEVGSAWVNSHQDISPAIPFGGAKQSGIGVENSVHGMEEYTRIQVISTPGA
ncbi:MAG: aldehyde dehydrogenase family protein [Pseudomonadales bacterium]|nr:aldehyde dehydrogenase family protein [Pseudomonadales bacterium]